MSGLLLRIRLGISLLLLLLHLVVAVVLQPFRSVILACLLLIWFVWGIYSVHLNSTVTPTLSTAPTTPLFELVISDLVQAGFEKREVTLLELRTQQKIWETTNQQLSPARDILLNGALLYFALGDSQKAQELYSAAQQSDPNNPIFQLQIPQLYK